MPLTQVPTGMMAPTGVTAGSYTLSSITVDASGRVTAASNGSAASLTLGTAQNTTSGTSIDFTGIPAGVKRITVMLNGLSTNGTSPPMIQLGSGSITTSGYLGSNSVVTAAGFSSFLFTTGFGIGCDTTYWAGIIVVHGAITFTLLTGNNWVCTGSVGRTDNASPSTYFTNGSVTLSGAIDRLRLTTLGGANTFDAGSVNIMYE